MAEQATMSKETASLYLGTIVASITAFLGGVWDHVVAAFNSVMNAVTMKVHFGATFLASISFGIYGIVTGGLGLLALPGYVVLNTLALGITTVGLHILGSVAYGYLKDAYTSIKGWFAHRRDVASQKRGEAQREEVRRANTKKAD